MVKFLPRNYCLRENSVISIIFFPGGRNRFFFSPCIYPFTNLLYIFWSLVEEKEEEKEDLRYMEIVTLTNPCTSENLILLISKRNQTKEAYKLWNLCAFGDCYTWWYITQVFIQQILACLPIERDRSHCCKKSDKQFSHCMKHHSATFGIQRFSVHRR